MSAAVPTTTVAVLASGSCCTTPTNFCTVLPLVFSTPKNLYSWPTSTYTARPVMNPSSTGFERNWVTNPRRASLASRKTRPTTMTNAATYSWYSAGSMFAASLATPAATMTAVTDDAISAADAEVGWTNTWRELPSTAYSSSEHTSV